MKTAVEYIELRLLGIASFDSEELRLRYKDIIKQAKEIEKEQIIDAYKSGVKLIAGDIDDASNYYYNETFNQNN